MLESINFDIPKDKSILLLWSGGYDSTLLLIEALRLGYNVKTLYIEMENNKLKSKREIYKRHILKNKLEQKFSRVIEDLGSKQYLIYKEMNNYSYFQPFVWLTHSLLNNSITDYICLGYLKTSDFWHIHNYWKESFYSLQKCLLTKNSKIIEPLFPLEWITKYECREYFKYYYEDFYKLCHTCENPIIEKGRIVDCNKCITCKNFQEVTSKLLKEDEIVQCDESKEVTNEPKLFK